MSEIQREEILAQRLEEIQRILDKRNLGKMLKAQTSQTGDDGERPSKAAKRGCNRSARQRSC
jgi:RNA polymerase-associated protein RTF1